MSAPGRGLLARFFHPGPPVPFRPRVRRLALLASLVLGLSPWRVPAGMAAAPGPDCYEPPGCERCPTRRAPPSCSSCPRALDGVTARRVALAAPAPARRFPATPGERVTPAAPAARTAALRHDVLGDSPPTHLLLATLRN